MKYFLVHLKIYVHNQNFSKNFVELKTINKKLLLLNNEINKLVLFTSGRRIEEEDGPLRLFVGRVFFPSRSSGPHHREIEKREPQLRTRPINLRNLNQELKIIKEIYNQAWSKNWGFVPLTEEEINLLAKELKSLVVPDLVLFAYWGEEPVGFSVSLPDYNEVLKHLNGKIGLLGLLKFLYYSRKIDKIRVMLLGIKHAFQKKSQKTNRNDIELARKRFKEIGGIKLTPLEGTFLTFPNLGARNAADPVSSLPEHRHDVLHYRGLPHAGHTRYEKLQKPCSQED
jgi:hypothetical protein